LTGPWSRVSAVVRINAKAEVLDVYNKPIRDVRGRGGGATMRAYAGSGRSSTHVLSLGVELRERNCAGRRRENMRAGTKKRPELVGLYCA